VAAGNPLIIAYYSLSLFVMGGVDLGAPIGGPLWGRTLVWISYFGSPILAAWTLIQAILHSFAPQSWQLRHLSDHVIVVSSTDLTLTYLRKLRREHPRVKVVVVCKHCDASTAEEIRETYNAPVITGDITHRYFLEQLRPHLARRILLLGDHSMRNYEAASHILEMVPHIGRRLVIHCGRLRFLRAMSDTRVAQQCQTFNSYHLAAAGLVRHHLVRHFLATRRKDAVILAGFGRFGQTIVEQLQEKALDEMEAMVIIDNDVERRVLVADEQMKFAGNYRRELFEGDISHPEVWRRVWDTIAVNSEDTVIVLGTGDEEENLRTALWLRKKAPRARIIARSSTRSRFADEVGSEHDIFTVSIADLVEENIPEGWLRLD
jgi:Trk K+ transport system NAD-binding subunit